MSRSNIIKLSGFIICCFSLFCAIWCSSPHRPYPNIVGDPTGFYAPAIETGVVCDWHSALFLQECIWIRSLLSTVGCALSGVETLMCVWYFSAAVIFSISLYGVIRLARMMEHPTIFLYTLSVFMVGNLVGLVCNLYMDFYFIANLIALLFFIYLSSKCNNYLKRLVCLSVFVLLSCQMIELRKNSLLLLPFLFFVELHLLWPKLNRILVVSIALVISCGMYLMLNQLVQKYIVIQKTYPASCMMLCDMSIASTYRGESPTWRREIYEVAGYKHGGRPCYRACLPTYLTSLDSCRRENWIQLKKIYINEWKENFSTMIAARVVQVVEFYMAGYIPKCLVEEYEQRFNLGGAMRKSIKPLTFKQKFLVGGWIAVAAISLLYVCFLLWQYMRRKLPGREKTILFLGLVAWGYAASFLVVTPTPDARYRAFSTYVLCVVAAYAVTKCLPQIRDRFLPQNANQ